MESYSAKNAFVGIEGTWSRYGSTSPYAFSVATECYSDRVGTGYVEVINSHMSLLAATNPFKNQTGYTFDTVYDDFIRYQVNASTSIGVASSYVSSSFSAADISITHAAATLEEEGYKVHVCLHGHQIELVAYCQFKGWNTILI